MIRTLLFILGFALLAVFIIVSIVKGKKWYDEAEDAPDSFEPSRDEKDAINRKYRQIYAKYEQEGHTREELDAKAAELNSAITDELNELEKARKEESTSTVNSLFIKFITGIICAVVSLIFIIIIPGSFHQVDAGTYAVVKQVGEITEVRTPGTYFDFYMTKEYQIYDATVQQVKITTTAYSQDGQTMDLEVYLQYQIQLDKLIIKDSSGNIIQTEGVAGKYVTLESLQARIETQCIEKTKAVMSSATAMDIIQQRAVFSTQVSQTVRDAIGPDYYVNVQDVVLTDISFSDAFEKVVEEKVAQQQTYEKALIEQQQALAQAENEKKIAEVQAQAAAAKARIAAEAEAEVVKIQAGAAEFQGQKEAAIALQRLAGINGWSVLAVVDETTGSTTYKLIKTDGTEVTESERSVGVQKLIEYYYTQTWDGKLPETYVGEDGVSSIIVK